MIEELFKNAILNPPTSYSPEKVVEVLNSHSEAIQALVKFNSMLLILWLALAIYVIINGRCLSGRLKKIENKKTVNSR